MTDVLVRDLEQAQPEPAPPRHDTAVGPGEVPVVALAALAAAAGAVHLVVVPGHVDEYAPLGIAFALAGWSQLALAAAFVHRATTTVLRLAVAVNTAFLVAWIVSRTAGLPVGPNAGVAERIDGVDLTCIAAEGALVALCLVTLTGVRRVALRRAAALAGVAAVVAATVAIASPAARSHAHTEVASGTHAHASTASTATDLGLGMLHNGHHEAITVRRLSPATQAALDAQLDLTRQVATTYPTLADAVAAGYRRAGPYSPGLGLHVVRASAEALNADGRMDREDLLHPMAIIYDGTAPTSRVAGFMYYSARTAEPEGFAGPNDHWHYHTNVCIKLAADGTDAPLGADRSTTKAQCGALGGFLLEKTQWMVHVWSVPTYEVADADGGVFGEVNPDLRCPDGTYFRLPAPEWPAHPTNICRSARRG